MGRCGAQHTIHNGAHLKQVDLAAVAGGDERCFRTGETAPDDTNSFQLTVSSAASEWMASSATLMMRHSLRKRAPRL